MTGLFQRTKAAVSAFMKPSAGLREFAVSTVRPMEANTQYGRVAQYTQAELMAYFCGTVKTACSRTAIGVAKNTLRVMRKRGGKSAAFEGRRLARKHMQALRHYAGPIARKALDIDDEAEEVIDPVHPLNVLLHEPNPRMGFFDLIEATQNCLGLAGNLYWKKARDSATGYPVEVWPLFPQFVHAVPDRERVISRYIYGRGLEIEQSYDAKDVVHFRYFNPRGDPYYGLGDVAAVAAEAKVGFQLVAMVQAMIDNGGQPGAILVGPFTPEQRAQMEVSVQAKTAGPQNAGRWAFVSAPESTKILTMDLGEQAAKFLANTSRVDEVVANAFDIPVEFLNMRPGGLSGESPAIKQWQTFGLEPRGRKIEDTINRLLVPDYGDDSLFVVYDPWIQEDEGKTMVALTGAYEADILTKNETRAELGWDVTDDPSGDEFKSATASRQGVDAFAEQAKVGAQYESANGGGSGARGGATGGAESGGGGKRLRAPAITRVVRGVLPNGDDGKQHDPSWEHEGIQSRRLPPVPGSGGVQRASGGALGREQQARPTEAHEKIASARVLLFAPESHTCCTRLSGKDDRFRPGPAFNATERELEAALRDLFAGLSPHIAASVTESGGFAELGKSDAFQAAFASIADPVLARIFRDGLTRGLNDVRGRMETATLNEALNHGAAAFLKEYTGPLIASVTDTIDQRIRDTLAGGLEAGETRDQLTGRVQEVMGDAERMGAERIARTESSRALLSGRVKAWKESGIVAGKKWLLSSDPCEFCEAMADDYNQADLDGSFLPMGATLTGKQGGKLRIDYAAIDTPPVHPNCRCGLVPVFGDAP